MAEQNAKLDVVADFAYQSENKAYNRAYRQWRRTNKAPYMYRYSGNPNEITYVDGNAVSMPDAPRIEQKALMHCAARIGLALLLCLFMELVCGTGIVGIMRLLGVQIRLDFLSLSVSGSQWAVVIARALTNLLKYGVPAAVLLRICRIPRRVSVPFCIGGLPELIVSAGAAMCSASAEKISSMHGMKNTLSTPSVATMNIISSTSSTPAVPAKRQPRSRRSLNAAVSITPTQ